MEIKDYKEKAKWIADKRYPVRIKLYDWLHTTSRRPEEYRRVTIGQLAKILFATEITLRRLIVMYEGLGIVKEQSYNPRTGRNDKKQYKYYIVPNKYWDEKLHEAIMQEAKKNTELSEDMSISYELRRKAFIYEHHERHWHG